MSLLPTRVHVSSEAYRSRRDRNLELLQQVRELEEEVRAHSAEKAERFHARGQWLPRERLGALLDPAAPFLELSTLAGHQTHGDEASGGGVVTGIGFVAGRRVAVYCSDSAVKGGAVSPMGLKKALRLQEISHENRLPTIHLVESAGANLLHQAELFVEGGRIFANLARLSAAGIPQITVVHGPSTAGGAYIPGLSDHVIGVRRKSRIYLAGPPLVKAALGEDAEEESLGGAEMHARVTGTVDELADDDADAVARVRSWVRTHLPRPPPPEFSMPSSPAEPPQYDPDELLGIVEPDPRKPFPAREVIARVVDGSEFREFKSEYGPEMVCGFASIEGHRVGLLANDGPIDPNGAAKAAQFILTACQLDTPLVYLQNTTGYLVGTQAEQAGIVKHGAQMIRAVANATVPQITFLVGGAYGAGNYGMCGRSFGPRFIFAWPNARISVMGPDQAAQVMEIIRRQAPVPPDPDHLNALKEKIRSTIEAESTALYGSARLWDDGIIDPRQTRNVAAFVLATCAAASRNAAGASTFGVLRF